MTILLALAPIGLLLTLLLRLRWSAGAAASAAAGMAAIIAVAAFDHGDQGFALGLAVPFVEALFQSATILWIILPALCIHEYQVASGGTALLRRAVSGLSDDPRIVALLIAWFFALCMEGAAELPGKPCRWSSLRRWDRSTSCAGALRKHVVG